MRELLSSPGFLMVLCLAVSLGGLLLFVMALRGEQARKQAVLWLIALCVGSSCVYGQDFEAAARRSPPADVAVASAATVTTPADPMDWTAALSRPVVDLLNAGCQDIAASAPQALVFTRDACSECRRLEAYIKEKAVPLGWIASDDPAADFRFIDIRKSPEVARLYGVDVVPTVVYLNRYGRIVERRTGFSVLKDQNWTGPLVGCR